LIRKSGRKGDKIVCSQDASHDHGYHEPNTDAAEHAA